MEASDYRLREVFTQMLKYSEEDNDYITLKEFKKIVEDYQLEFIKGQELNDDELHESCRQIFSQLCQQK